MSRAASSDWLIPAALLGASLLGSAWLALRPSDAAQPVAVLFPPWWSGERSLRATAASGGAVLRFGAWPGLVVVQSSAAGFSGRLRASGAWLLLNPKAAGLCGSPSEPRP